MSARGRLPDSLEPLTSCTLQALLVRSRRVYFAFAAMRTLLNCVKLRRVRWCCLRNAFHLVCMV